MVTNQFATILLLERYPIVSKCLKLDSNMRVCVSRWSTNCRQIGRECLSYEIWIDASMLTEAPPFETKQLIAFVNSAQSYLITLLIIYAVEFSSMYSCVQRYGTHNGKSAPANCIRTVNHIAVNKYTFGQLIYGIDVTHKPKNTPNIVVQLQFMFNWQMAHSWKVKSKWCCNRTQVNVLHRFHCVHFSTNKMNTTDQIKHSATIAISRCAQLPQF